MAINPTLLLASVLVLFSAGACDAGIWGVIESWTGVDQEWVTGLTGQGQQWLQGLGTEGLDWVKQVHGKYAGGLLASIQTDGACLTAGGTWEEGPGGLAACFTNSSLLEGLGEKWSEVDKEWLQGWTGQGKEWFMQLTEDGKDWVQGLKDKYGDGVIEGIKNAADCATDGGTWEEGPGGLAACFSSQDLWDGLVTWSGADKDWVDGWSAEGKEWFKELPSQGKEWVKELREAHGGDQVLAAALTSLECATDGGKWEEGPDELAACFGGKTSDTSGASTFFTVSAMLVFAIAA